MDSKQFSIPLITSLSLVRQSDGKRDAAEKLQHRFELDASQVEAILETPIYKLSRTDIKKMLEELTEKAPTSESP